MSQLFTSGGQSIGTSASTSVLPMNTQLISFRMDWFDLLAVQGTFKSLLQHHKFERINSLALSFFMIQLSHQYTTTGKTKALTAAAAKSLQSCLTLCDPRDGSPPVPVILQARTLEWVAISFSNA